MVNDWNRHPKEVIEAGHCVNSSGARRRIAIVFWKAVWVLGPRGIVGSNASHYLPHFNDSGNDTSVPYRIPHSTIRKGEGLHHLAVKELFHSRSFWCENLDDHTFCRKVPQPNRGKAATGLTLSTSNESPPKLKSFISTIAKSF